ncbi:MAG: DNA polymerase I, partial [Deltaproteobacteria bacterium]|nr:DNA polymerase I [Deltaproteobacteria bacterium]
MEQEKDFYVIDGSSYIYRAFYALGRLTSPRGMPTQAIYGFAQMLLKVVRERNPSSLCVVFDPPGPTFRHELYTSYKATRQTMPEDLLLQIPFIKDFVKLCGIPQLEAEGFEADDVIATLTRAARDSGSRVIIVSGDKDLHQLVQDPSVIQWDPQRDRVMGEREILERYGVTAGQFIDYLSLVGDSSDNVPGVKGVGEKSARQLLQQWESLEGIYGAIDGVTPPSLRKKLLDRREAAFLSKRLVSLKNDVPLDTSLERFVPEPPDRERLMRFCEDLGFRSLLENLKKEWGTPLQAGSSPPPGGLHFVIQVIREPEAFGELVRHLARNIPFSLRVETSSQDPMRSEMEGIAFCYQEDSVSYVPLSRHGETDGSTRYLEEAIVMESLEPLLSDRGIQKAGHDLKHDAVVLLRHGIRLEGMVFDSMVGNYLLDPSRGSHKIERVTEEVLRIPFPAPLKVDAQETLPVGDAVSGVEGLDGNMCRSCAHAAAALRLMPPILRSLEETRQTHLFQSLEMPLISVLARMEWRGILVDPQLLRTLNLQFQETLEERASAIYRLAGEEFNIQSPKQLASILFDKLQLPV